MRRGGATAALLMLLVADHLPATAAEGAPFVAEGFAIDFPAPPDVVAAGMATADIAGVHTYQSEAGGTAFRVTVFRLTDEADRDEVMAFAARILTNEECSVAADATVVTPAGEARDITSTCRGETVRARLIFGPGHLYEPAVTGVAGFETAAATAGFLDSFRLRDGGPDWLPVTADADGFRADFPGTPVEKVRSFDPSSFTGTNAYIAYEGDGLFRITAIHFRPEVRAGATPEQVFDYARETAPARCATLFDGPLDLAAGPAREIAGRCPDGVDFRLRFVLAGDSLYEVFTSGPAGFIAGADAERFLASFAVLPQ